MALIFAVKHIYFKKIIASVHYFFSYILFLNLVLINRRNGPRYQRVLALCAFFFNSSNTEGTNCSKSLCLTFVYVLLYVNLCQN